MFYFPCLLAAATSVCYLLGIGLGPSVNTRRFDKDLSSFSGTYYNVALNKHVTSSSNLVEPVDWGDT